MDKVDLRAFMFCSTVFPSWRPGETSSCLIFPNCSHQRSRVLCFLFLPLTSFQSPSYSTLGQQSRQNGTGGKSGSTAPASLLLSKSMEGERTKQRDSPQGDAGMGPLLVYAHRCSVKRQQQTKKTPKWCKGVGEELKKKKMGEMYRGKKEEVWLLQQTDVIPINRAGQNKLTGQLVSSTEAWSDQGKTRVIQGGYEGVKKGWQVHTSLWVCLTCSVRLLLSSVWIHARRVSSVMKIWAALANRTGASALIICTERDGVTPG